MTLNKTIIKNKKGKIIAVDNCGHKIRRNKMSLIKECSDTYAWTWDIDIMINDLGMDPNCKAKDGRTPLTEACDSGNSIIVKYLLSLPNIDVNLRGRLNRTPLTTALHTYTGNRKETIVHLLLQSKANVEIGDIKDSGYWISEDLKEEMKKLLVQEYFNQRIPAMMASKRLFDQFLADNIIKFLF